MCNPYEPPQSASAQRRESRSLLVLLVHGVARATLFVMLVKALSYDLTHDRVAIIDIPRQVRPLLWPIIVYSLPIWITTSFQYRCGVMVVQSILGAAGFGTLWAWCLDARLAEVVYWSTIIGLVLAVYAISVDVLVSRCTGNKGRSFLKDNSGNSG